jgi:hypothetical protein
MKTRMDSGRLDGEIRDGRLKLQRDSTCFKSKSLELRAHDLARRRKHVTIYLIGSTVLDTRVGIHSTMLTTVHLRSGYF